MPVDQLQELIEYVQSLEARIKTLETSPSQQNMTVDKGATRILSDEGLQVGEPGSSTGSEIVYGKLTIFGRIDGDGTFEWSGGWRFDSGDGEIAGNVALTGDFDLTGLFKAGNVRIEDGKIKVGASDQIVIDGATGRITVGTGASQIVIDGVTGEITVPGSNPIRLHQVGGLARVDLGSTGSIWSGGDGITIARGANGFVNVYSGGVDVGGGPGGKIDLSSNNLNMSTSIPNIPVGATTRPLHLDMSTGRVHLG